MIVINVIYEAENTGALDYVKEVKETGLQEAIKKEEGCVNYEYYSSLDIPNKVFLLEKWKNAYDVAEHNNSENMKKLGEIKKKYNITTTVEKFQTE